MNIENYRNIFNTIEELITIEKEFYNNHYTRIDFIKEHNILTKFEKLNHLNCSKQIIDIYRGLLPHKPIHHPNIIHNKRMYILYQLKTNIIDNHYRISIVDSSIENHCEIIKHTIIKNTIKMLLLNEYNEDIIKQLLQTQNGGSYENYRELKINNFIEYIEQYLNLLNNDSSDEDIYKIYLLSYIYNHFIKKIKNRQLSYLVFYKTIETLDNLKPKYINQIKQIILDTN